MNEHTLPSVDNIVDAVPAGVVAVAAAAAADDIFANGPADGERSDGEARMVVVGMIGAQHWCSWSDDTEHDCCSLYTAVAAAAAALVAAVVLVVAAAGLAAAAVQAKDVGTERQLPNYCSLPWSHHRRLSENYFHYFYY